MKLNEILRECRLKTNMTQEQTAERLGVSASDIMSWEEGRTTPDINLLPALAGALDTDINTLFAFPGTSGGKEEKLREVSEYIGCGEYDQAQKALDELPEEDDIYRRRLQAGLYFVQGKLSEATEVTERSLLEETANLQSAMLLLLEIRLKAGELDEAREIADILGRFVPLMEMQEYGAYAPQLLIAAAREDAKECIWALKRMKAACRKTWDNSSTVLYRHLPGANSGRNEGEITLAAMLADFLNPENQEYEFLRNTPEFWDILESWSREWEAEE